jgi:hypothetical protein
MKNASNRVAERASCAALLIGMAACTQAQAPASAPPSKASVKKESFGATKEGVAVNLYTLTNAGGWRCGP